MKIMKKNYFFRNPIRIWIFLVSILLTLNANAVTIGTANGTYDFGTLGSDNSGGSGFKTQGDKFKISNAFLSGGTALYLNTGASASVVIKAEGGSTMKQATVEDLAIGDYGTTTNDLQLTQFDITLKNYSGATIATHSLSSSKWLTHADVLISSLSFFTAWPSGGYDNVSEIDITYTLNKSSANFEFRNIKLSNITATVAVAPTATTNAATSVTSTTVTLNGSVNANNASTAVTFEYGLTDSYGSSVTAAENPVTGTSNTGVTYALSSLTPNTTYHYRIKAVNVGGTTYGLDQTFTTSATAPDQSYETTVGTYLEMDVNDLTGIAHFTTSYYYTSYTPYQPSDGTHTATLYHYYDGTWHEMVASNEYSYTSDTTVERFKADYAGIYTFTVKMTDDDNYPTITSTRTIQVTVTSGNVAPTVTTQAVSSISTTTATGNGNITDLGIPNPTQYGVVWSTSTNPTVALTSKTAQGAIAITGAFTSSITGLDANTTYYVKAYATNTAGTSYGNEVSFTTKIIPTISWSNPADITYGTLLSATQLNATANTSGTFTYTPSLETKLNAGTTQTLKVDFTPTDLTNYVTASKTVTINVTKATPAITWSNPEDITYGTLLSATQLNATANVDGLFTYTPVIGTKLEVGDAQSLKADFEPTDAVNYEVTSKTVFINVLFTTSISEVGSNKLIISPNPVIDAFSVSGIDGLVQISLRDLNGRLILTKEVSNNEMISLATFSSGIYVITLEDINGLISKRIVKK